MRRIELLEEGNYYHIYNRGINGENVFKDRLDYLKFISRFEEYSTKAMDIFSYSLLMNHFHSLVYIKRDVYLERKDGGGFLKLLAARQLGHAFNAYAQSYNRAYQRTGGLFEKPFKRKHLESRNSLTNVVMYIHRNPQHHGFVEDFREWSYTSYHELIGDGSTFLQREKVMEWFGGKENFIEAHLKYSALVKEEDEWVIE